MYSLKKAHSSRECAQKAYVYKIRPSLSIQATCYEINKMRNRDNMRYGSHGFRPISVTSTEYTICENFTNII